MKEQTYEDWSEKWDKPLVVKHKVSSLEKIRELSEAIIPYLPLVLVVFIIIFFWLAYKFWRLVNG